MTFHEIDGRVEAARDGGALSRGSIHAKTLIVTWVDNTNSIHDYHHPLVL